MRAKETQRAHTTERLPLLRFPANPFGADSLSPQQDGAWSLDWKYSSLLRSHITGAPSSYSGGEETGENAQILGPPPAGLTARLHEKKRNPRPKSSIQEVSQRWTLKACFSFFHCASDGVPKILAYFSCFLYEHSI
ncbi:hypothetical protein ABD77_23750 [Brevibacillus formosus]|nr:hypothetical protein [Brevibacillus formosus]